MIKHWYQSPIFRGGVVAVIVTVGVVVVSTWWWRTPEESGQQPQNILEMVPQPTHPLMISEMRKQTYLGSDITVEEQLTAGSNYQRQRVSYQSEGNTIYALMTIPLGEKPAAGWPVIVFNHGYIAPDQYRTTERYVAYVEGFARRGYIVFKSDYRGHGSSEGQATGGYGSPDYTVDVLNAVASLKKHPDVDATSMGMWGHSMGGHITLRSMVVTSDIKAGVIWGGVVTSYPNLINNWRRQPSAQPSASPSAGRRWRQVLSETYGEPTLTSPFWQAISPNSYVKDISGPIQLHHATGDETVPYQFSQDLEADLKQAGKPVEAFMYQGDDHDLTLSFGRAMSRSVEFFDRYLKKTE